jgi:hypothetical protein
MKYVFQWSDGSSVTYEGNALYDVLDSYLIYRDKPTVYSVDANGMWHDQKWTTEQALETIEHEFSNMDDVDLDFEPVMSAEDFFKINLSKMEYV